MKIIVFLLLALFFVSCEKETTMHITAKNLVTGQVYPNLKYYVVEYKSGTFEGKYHTILEGTLNGNGEVFLTEKLKKNRLYVVRVEGPENVCYQTPEEVSYTYSISEGENPTFDFRFAECAYLKLNINNINCMGTTDTMNFRSQYSYMNPDGSWSTDRIGCYNYLSPSYFNVPEGWRVYELRIKRNGFVSFKKDSIFLNNGVNSTINLDY